MSARQLAILSELQVGPISSFGLSLRVGAPTASVRRDIQSLRRLGHRIDDARDNNGQYRLVQG